MGKYDNKAIISDSCTTPNMARSKENITNLQYTKI